jgi:UDP-N-acetylmuramoylalanine--D-glutamate ligase
MRTCDLADTDVGLAGFGAEGRATRAALVRTGHRGRLLVLDDAAPRAGETLEWRSGGAAVEAVASLGVVVASPGLPPHHPILAEARRRAVPVTTATNLFLAEMRAMRRPVVAVTGSKGKSTTSTLLHRALEGAGRASALVGNIGAPALDQVDDILMRKAIVVMETSSYQAHHVDQGPDIVVLLDLFPEHVPWHGSVEAYYEAKLRLARTQPAAATTIWNGASAELRARAPFGAARQVAYATREGFHFEGGWFLRGGERLFGDARMPLRGLHNRVNACAVLAACHELSVGASAVQAALEGFTGLPHRLERLGDVGGLTWIDDAISTAPESAVAALEAFSGEARALIAGGQDRGLDFAPLARAIGRHGISHVALVPDTGGRIAEAIRAAGLTAVVVRECADLADAVAWIAREAPRGCTVLFSPASPSYGPFRNFEHRGATFRHLVHAHQ